MKKNKSEIKEKKTGVKYEKPEIKSRGTIKLMCAPAVSTPAPTSAPS